MSPSAKKRPKNSKVSKMQDEKLQDKTEQPLSKVIERNRLRTVLKNLSLLKLLKSSNRRIQELHKLAKRCWHSLLSVPKILRISSGENSACNKAKQNNEEFQEIGCSKKELKSKKLESTGDPKKKEYKEWKPQVQSRMSNKAKTSSAAMPWKEKHVEPEVPRTSRDHGLNLGAQGRQLLTEGPRVIFIKPYHNRTPMGHMKQLNVADQWIWFEGLPTRIHLPAPRVMCRSSTLRWVKRCCTRFCSASLEMPMWHPYKVDVTWTGARGASRGRRSRSQLKGRDGWRNSRVYK
ncbi:PREDICTED: TP53-target gene 5 protein [Mandrillus leucophaeus]|uniref:TP53 target 5 n=1 Tax=Mandrillus leucophaeus TaxID=9568 RepID=A0A2K6A5T3_MANLE|nr:PREDICTED: TP53-target gene 5 protein [Mandrillus leucophaeus]XP_011857397.1 PREDICTED: TP53-target gene 5 protein [Mandrillus leucophaeus]